LSEWVREIVADKTGRLKPRLHKRCPPTRTKENNVISTAFQRSCFLQPAEAGFVCVDAVSTARSYLQQFLLPTPTKKPGFSPNLRITTKYSRKNPVSGHPRVRKRRLKPRLHKRCPPPRTKENNVISTIVFSSTRGGGFCSCRRGFNRRV